MVQERVPKKGSDDERSEQFVNFSERFAQRERLLEDSNRSLAQIDAVIEDQNDDELVLSRMPLHRHPSIPSNIVGVRFLDPTVFGGQEDLRLAAVAMEEDRGIAGFTPNTVRSVYDGDANLVLPALSQVVQNYRTWK